VGSILPVDSFTVSPTEELLVCVDRNQDIQIWELDDNEIRNTDHRFVGHDQGILSAKFSADGQTLITETTSWVSTSNLNLYMPQARVWDLQKPINNRLDAKIRSDSILKFDHDWLTVIDLTNSGMATHWNVATNKTHRVDRAKRLYPARNPSIQQLGPWLVGRDRIWDLTKQNPFAMPIISHEAHLGRQAIQVSPSRRFLAGLFRNRASKKFEVRICDLESETQTTPIKILPFDRAQVSLGFSADESWFVTVNGGNVNLWDLRTQLTDSKSLSLEQFNSNVEFEELLFANNDKIVSLDTADGTLLWDVGASDKAPTPVILEDERSAAFSNNRDWLLTQGTDHSLHLYDLSRGLDDIKTEFIRLNAEPGQAVVCQFSKDGQRLVVLKHSYPNTALVWDLGDNEFERTPRVYSMQRFNEKAVLSPDGNWLVSGYNSSEVHLQNLRASQDRQSIVLTGHQTSVFNFSFSNDNRWLATSGGTDGWLWDLESHDVQKSGVELPISDVEGNSSGLVFSGDSRWLATQSSSLFVWRLREEELIVSAKRLAGREFSEDERNRFQSPMIQVSSRDCSSRNQALSVAGNQ